MKELEDYDWFPDVLRRQQTSFIGWMVQLFRVYRDIPLLMNQHLKSSALQHITDMGSGSGGPVPQLSGHPLFKDSRFVLTDLYPHSNISLPESCHYLNDPVDARVCEAAPGSTITFFNTLHHFSLEEQKGIITRQLSRGHSLLVAEILTPDLWCTLRIMLATTLGQVLFAPFVKPFQWSRLLFTWIVPVNLITVTWDGLISVWKSPGSLRRQQLKSHAEAIGAHGIWVQAGSALLPVQVFLCTAVSDQ
jgi:hypothetical protein